MGEAKRKADALRALMLAECELWSKPPSDLEAAALVELQALPSVRAFRASPRDIQQMGMVSKDCHENCRWYAANDPAGEWQHVFGWWMQPATLVLHSLVRRGDDYMCITPQADPAVARHFRFIPDETIAFVDDGERRVLLRNGQDLHPGVRLDPTATIEYMGKVRARLNSPMPPFEAWNIDYHGRQFDDA